MRAINVKVGLVLFIIIFTFSSCFKEEAMDVPNIPDAGNTAVIDMGPQYSNQFFYNLSTNKVVSQNSRFAYDLMFECSDSSFYVWLNTSKFMSVLKTNKQEISFVSLQDTVGKEWKYELGSFETDSSAIGKWGNFSTEDPSSFKNVYILDLGRDESDQALGYIKFRFEDYDYQNNSYEIRYSFMNENIENTLKIQKDNSRVYRYLSFTNNRGVVDGIEPSKEDWDFCFTRYTVIFYQPYYLPYIVTGVLSNPTKIEAYVDSTIQYSDAKLETLQFNKLSRKRDCIGYDWKQYESGDYFTKDYFTYYIRRNNQEFYKLRFITFKKDAVWGYPTFEYNLLQ